jgi:LemA protein
MIETVVAICIVLAIVLLIVLATYNGLMHQRQEVRSAWSQMDEQLKQRYVLVPLLINTVQSIGGEAVGKLAAVSAAKNQAAVAFSPAELAKAEAALSSAIRDVLITFSRDASLTNLPGFLQVQQQLLASEQQIEQARQRYNDRVEALNLSIHSFPQVLTARAIGLQPQAGFEF